MSRGRKPVNSFDFSEMTSDVEGETQETKKEETKDVASVQSFIDQISAEAGNNINGNGLVKDLDPTKKYHVMSVTYGGLTYKSEKTGTPFRWKGLGDTKEMSRDEIFEMNAYNGDYLERPCVVLLEKETVDYFRLEELYRNMSKINDLTSLFKKDIETISATIDEALENDLRNFLIAKVRTMYENKKLTDINVIKLLKDKLHFEFANI